MRIQAGKSQDQSFDLWSKFSKEIEKEKKKKEPSWGGKHTYTENSNSVNLKMQE